MRGISPSSFTLGCPECGSINFRVRTRKTPKYRCEKCNHEFNALKRIDKNDR